MRIFVCGATGLIGRSTLPYLRGTDPAPSHSITALSRSPANSAALSAQGVTPVSGDITTLDVLQAQAKESDVVLYAAFDHSNPSLPAEAAREGPALRAIAAGLAANGSPTKLLLACGGLAFCPSDKLTTELDPIDASFRTGALQALQHAAENGVVVLSIRLGMVVHSPARPHMFLEVLKAQGDLTGAVPYHSAGSNRWPCASGDDVGQLIASVIEQRDKLEPGKINAVHAYSEQISTRELAQGIASQFGWRTQSLTTDEVKALGPLHQLIMQCDPNISNQWTRETFGWDPKGRTVFGDAKEGKYWGKEFAELA